MFKSLPSLDPISLDFIIYDPVSLKGTLSKSSFLFHTDNIIFIKLIFQEALFYSDFPEPGEIIWFLPLGLKENLSITNIDWQRNFFCKKLKPPWHKEHRGWDDRQTTKESLRGRGSTFQSPALCVPSWAKHSHWAKSGFKRCTNLRSLETDQSEPRKVPGWIPPEQILTLSLPDHRKISG